MKCIQLGYQAIFAASGPASAHFFYLDFETTEMQLNKYALTAIGSRPVLTLHTISFAIAFTIITFRHIVLGELAPKTLALERAEKVALTISWPMRDTHARRLA